VEISSKRGGKKPKRKKPHTSCSALQQCPAEKYCIPFISKCTRGNEVFRKECYIDAHCPDDETCSISVGFCLAKPKCRHMKPYSFCRKGWCPCPDGYECKGRFNHQECLPIEVGSGEARIIVN
ncbi:Hypothetical predicted protein, partial [Paramuricea clavata]